MSLFGGLPVPGPRSRREVDEDAEERLFNELQDLPDEEEEAEAFFPDFIEEPQLRRRPRHATDDEDEAEPPAALEQHLRKRVRHTADEPAQPTPPQAPNSEPAGIQQQYKHGPAAEPAQDQPVDQVSVALRKITSHISNPAKFAKAAPLLRQLLEGDALNRAHRIDCFEAIKAAFPIDPDQNKHLVDPMLRREVMKLVTAVDARPDLFRSAERAQLEVYHIIARLRNELSTDDSFVFSKVIAKIRELVDELPSCTPAVEVAYAEILDLPVPEAAAAAAAEEEQLQQQLLQQKEAAAARQRAAEEDPFGLDSLITEPSSSKPQADAEADPFGLDTMLEQPAAAQAVPAKPVPPQQREQPAAPAKPSSTAWSAAETAAALRRALLDCVQHSSHFHKHAWAKTGIELLIEHCHQHKDRFCMLQRDELEEMMRWVRQQRALRKQGPSQREINRDSTSFERARAEWSKATVSTRGKVGGNGDAKANNWLG